LRTGAGAAADAFGGIARDPVPRESAGVRDPHLYTNPFTIVPLYYIAYKLGMFVTGGNGHILPGGELDLLALPIMEWIPALYHWLAAMGKPFALGLFLLALILAVAGYLLVIAAWRVHVTLAWNKRRRMRIFEARK
jgi:uncharacterized protein (DUF2062 family)